MLLDRNRSSLHLYNLATGAMILGSILSVGLALCYIQQQTAIAQEKTAKTTAIPTTTTTTMQANANNFSAYSNPSSGFKIGYPATWNVEEGNLFDKSVVKFISPSSSERNGDKDDNVREYFEMDVSPAGLETVDRLASSTINTLRQLLPEFQLIESNASVSIAGSPAHKVVYTYKSSDGSFYYHVMQIWVIKTEKPFPDKSFRFTYVAEATDYADYLSVIKSMIKSFEVI